MALHKKRKIKPETIDAILELAWKGYPITYISEKLGVSYSTVKRYTRTHPVIGTH